MKNKTIIIIIIIKKTKAQNWKEKKQRKACRKIRVKWTKQTRKSEKLK